MARVFLAHDATLDRDVALKILWEQYADNEEFVERFKREARSAAALSHPNIVSVYDWGCSEDEMYYMAMEYVPGGTLMNRIFDEGALDPCTVAELGCQVAEALEFAHKRGVIHRDVKPQNILLTPSDEAKVADFGIARAVGAMAATSVSQAGIVLGTVGYMSPEQALGEPVSPQGDLYSLGVVLYEMLTGTRPYSGEDPASIVFQHVNEPTRSPREANPTIPEPLDALTTKLLAKDPEDRYANAVEVADELERVRTSLSPLSGAATEKTTTEMVAPSSLSGGEQRGQTTTIRQYVPTPIMKVFISGARGRDRLVRILAAILCGAILLGGLAWALTHDQAPLQTFGLEEAPSEGEAAPSIVEVPQLYYASETEDTLEEAGLELGERNEASDDTVPAGLVIEQDPQAGTTVEEGTAVDIVVSTGPEQVPVAIQGAPTSVGAASPRGGLAAQPAVPNDAANPKQVPAAIRGTPVSVDNADSSQEPPDDGLAAPSASGQTQAPAVVQAAPQEASPTQAPSVTIQTTSASSTLDEKEKK